MFGNSDTRGGIAVLVMETGAGTTVTMGSALAVTTAQPAPQLGSLTSPAYAASYDIIAGGAGSWVNPANAEGTPDGSDATWTAP